MDYDLEIGQMKENIALLLHAQQIYSKIQVSAAERAREVEAWRHQTEAWKAQTDAWKVEQEGWKRQREALQLEHEARMNHIELTLAEIGDKLNGLIGYMDGQARKQ